MSVTYKLIRKLTCYNCGYRYPLDEFGECSECGEAICVSCQDDHTAEYHDEEDEEEE